MQFLQIEETTRLSTLSERVGSRNLDETLALNDLTRTPAIGKQYMEKKQEIIDTTEEVGWQRKSTILNTLTDTADAFEIAALMGRDDWKVMSALNVLPNTIRIPETIVLPDATDIIGAGSKVGKTVYDNAMAMLESDPHTIDPSIFNEYSVIKSDRIIDYNTSTSTRNPFQYFNLPWGSVTLYSSIDGESVDIPAYPKDPSDSRKANYTTMPDLLYQYEPWNVYESSGPRSISIEWENLHRDMWSGDHNDGSANTLIRFCEAQLYPRFSGSAVTPAINTLYINGRPFVTGIITDVSVDWTGPILDDGWYAAFNLSLSFTEIASQALSYDTVRSMPLIGE